MIDIIAVIISFISLIIVIINQIQIIKDKEPQLAFSLKKFENVLYLNIKNTGKTKAKNIKVRIDKIYNNGNYGSTEDYIFQIPFELAANENVQGMIAVFGENISNHVFPYIDVTISYEKQHFKKHIKYSRQIFYSSSYEGNINVNTGLDINNIEHNINNLHKSVLRLANYFDGSEVAPFDELNIVSDNHFSNDMYNCIKGNKSRISTREECIKNRK